MPVHRRHQHAPWCHHCRSRSQYQRGYIQLGTMYLCLSHAIAEVQRRTATGKAKALNKASESTESARGANP